MKWKRTFTIIAFLGLLLTVFLNLNQHETVASPSANRHEITSVETDEAHPLPPPVKTNALHPVRHKRGPRFKKTFEIKRKLVFDMGCSFVLVIFLILPIISALNNWFDGELLLPGLLMGGLYFFMKVLGKLVDWFPESWG